MTLFRHFFVSSSVKHQKQKYTNLYEKFGFEIKSLHWSTVKNQEIRFKVLYDLLCHLNSKNLLDVGCGFGDLQTYLLKNELNLSYYGVDLVNSFIRNAQDAMPNANWIVADFLIYDFERNFDTVVFCGTFAFGNEKFFRLALQKAKRLANIAVVFNLYTTNNKNFFHMPEKKVISLVNRLGFRQVSVIDDYHINDKTYCLYV